MKKLTVFILTLALIAAMAVTTANAQQYVHTDTLIVPVRGTKGSTGNPVLGIAFKDNETLLSTIWDKTLRVWDVTTNTLRWHENIFDTSLEDPDIGTGFAVLGDDPLYIAYPFGTNRETIKVRVHRSGESTTIVSLGGHTGEVRSLTFKPNSLRLASASADNTIRIWDIWGRTRHVRTLRGHTSVVYSVAWSPDGRTLASTSADGTVRLWNPNNGINFAVLRGHTETVTCVAWSPDGRILASGSADKTLRLWNPDTYTIRRVLRGHTEGVRSLAFHPDGQTLASGSSDDTIRLWNPNTGTLKATLTGSRPLAFSPDGQILAGQGFSGRIFPGKPAEIHLYRWLTVDVTGNGSVTINDLVAVARDYHKTVAGGANWRADVNNDEKVDINDVLAVLKAIDAAAAAGEDVSFDTGEVPPDEPAVAQDAAADEGDETGDDAEGDDADGDWEWEAAVEGALPPAAPAAIKTRRALLQASDVRQWIRDAKQAKADPAGIAALERLLTSLNRRNLPVPKETVLLANYPNPFNPETWIPYQLSEAAAVTVTIHASDGKLVRTLELGQVPAGAYSDKGRAVYWDGRNEQGEPVASGVYFYTLKAGEFSATRKMVIRK